MKNRKRSTKTAAPPAPIQDANINANAPPLLRSTSSRVLNTLAEVAMPLAELTHQAATVAAEEAVNGCMVEYLGLLLGVPSSALSEAFDFSQGGPGKIIVEIAKKYGKDFALQTLDVMLSLKNLLLGRNDLPANSVPALSRISSFSRSP